MEENKVIETKTTAKKMTTAQIKAEATKKVKKAEKEKDEMAKSLKEMQESMKIQMEALQAQILNQSNIQPQVNVINQSNDNATRTIKVIGTLPYTQVLRTEPNERKENVSIYIIEDLYGFEMIPFAELQKITNASKKMFEDGRVILSCEKDYKDLGIGYIYDKVFGLEKLEEITMLEGKDVAKLISELSDNMREGILTTVIENINNDKVENLKAIKELLKFDIDVMEMSKNVEELKKLDEEKDKK